MLATRCLHDEHMIILGVLDCLETALSSADADGRAAREDFEPFLTFFRQFADGCHHIKEEDRLFPIMEDCGIGRDGGPIGVMIHEHEVGRAAVKRMDENLDRAATGDREALTAVIGSGREFLDMLRTHIDKEEHCLFPMAEQAVQGPNLERLMESYRAAEADPAYQEAYSRCTSIARELKERWLAPKPA